MGTIGEVVDLAVKFKGWVTPNHGKVNLTSANVDWPNGGNVVEHPHSHNPVLTITNGRPDLGAADEYFLQVVLEGRFSEMSTEPSILDASFYADVGNGRIGDDTNLTLTFSMEEGEIGQLGQYWVIPITVFGSWQIRHDCTIEIHGNGLVTQTGEVIWETMKLAPEVGRSWYDHWWQYTAAFASHSAYGTGRIHVEFVPTL
jgi:hypothetical protein